ncbi:hypothetical protein [Hymenobacter elongatus]|uniref:Uncharacterized protein n=1 Tax=Hymenobacter elongatus TaxID=877208 RepID=A0A4Z0PLN7_9BACT|nr:hypothetical protein [Hymenobacter elongatus]TGE16383.1 hypothetical protein E5J99_09660 [Hymenobacter elongatus]
MHAPLAVAAGRRLVRWLAYTLFQLALVLAFLLHSLTGLWSPFRRKIREAEPPAAAHRLSLPRSA